MRLRTINPYLSACPSRALIDLLGAKWTILVFGRLTLRPARFSEFADQTSGITPKELTKTLRQLERAGLVTRTVYPVVPPRVDYELTDWFCRPGRRSVPGAPPTAFPACCVPTIFCPSWTSILYLNAIPDRAVRRWTGKLAGVDVFTRENIVTMALSQGLDAPNEIR